MEPDLLSQLSLLSNTKEYSFGALNTIPKVLLGSSQVVKFSL